MMDNKILNLGIIGFGGMAAYHHDCLKDYNKIRVKGVFDLNPARMAVASSRGLLAYPSKEALLSDPNIDIVLVATTNEVHKDLSIEAMAAGKHVICEKPVTLSSDELREIIEAENHYNKHFTINHNRRTNKDFVLMKETVEAGLLGDVYVIESRVEGSRGMPTGWRTLKALGGGMMLDWGVHLIDQLLYMVPNRVTSVACQMFNIQYPQVDDNFRLQLGFDNGMQAQVEVSTNNYITHPRWYVLGKEGTLQIDDWDCQGKVVRRTDPDNHWEDEIVYTKAGPTKTMAPRRKESTETLVLSEPLHVTDHLSVVYDGLVSAIHHKTPLPITSHQALRVMQVMEAAFIAHDNQTTQKVNI